MTGLLSRFTSIASTTVVGNTLYQRQGTAPNVTEQIKVWSASCQQSPIEVGRFRALKRFAVTLRAAIHASIVVTRRERKFQPEFFRFWLGVASTGGFRRGARNPAAISPPASAITRSLNRNQC
jgi:hypothetical protein